MTKSEHSSLLFLLVCISRSFSAASQIDLHCGSLGFQPCTVRHYRYETDGFVCETTIGKSCLTTKHWCSAAFGYQVNEMCNNSENLMFSNCLSMDVAIDGRDYRIGLLKTDWFLAEQYCQSIGYHLTDFSDQSEYDLIIKFLQSISESRNLQLNSDVKLNDPLGQRCWSEILSHVGNSYWTGIYLDPNGDRWNTTNGQPLPREVASGRGSLNQAIAGSRQTLTNTFQGLSFQDTNVSFYVHHIDPENRRVDGIADHERIVCKRPKKFVRWHGGPSDENLGCITGFKCSGARPKCITGYGFHGSDVCNDVIDCEYGEDESIENCPRISISDAERRKTLIFSPIKRPLKKAREFCEKHNWTLPSIHSPQDIEFIKSLPKHFADQLQRPNFWLIMHNWYALEWRVPLGIRRDATTWDDGTEISFKERELRQKASHADVFLVFDKNGWELKSIFEDTNSVFTVCQTAGAPIYLVVPVILDNADRTFGSGILLFSLLCICLFHVRE